MNRVPKINYKWTFFVGMNDKWYHSLQNKNKNKNKNNKNKNKNKNTPNLYQN